MSADPYVIRSQRNRDRKPAPTQNDQSTLPDDPNAKGDLNYGTHSRLQLVRRREQLGYLSTGALILNKMVGTGVFVAPPTILAITGSKGISIVLWLVGGLVTWAGLAVYLEYGIRFPLTGGELHYVDYIWLRPPYLMTYMYSIMYVLLSGSQANALIFGKAVLMASTSEGTVNDERLQKFFAILLVAVVCQLQSLSRVNYVRFSNCFACYKIALLSIVTIIGWCALANRRTTTAASTDDPYGVINLTDSFKGTTTQAYPIALALLGIFRVYSGYENANFVLEEVRRPPGDETRVFRHAAKFTIVLVCFFYIMVNVALFAACSKDELLDSSDVLSILFTKVFGPSSRTRTASGILLAMSSAGNVMSVTFAAVRVKQEIARAGILPFPAFWAKSTRLNTPGPALLLHWIFSTIFIIATPLSSVNGYLVFSTLFNYARTVVGIVLGIALVCAPFLSSFRHNGKRWTPQGTTGGYWLVVPLTVIYILANLFVFVVSWFPASLQDILNTKSRVTPSYVGPTVSMATFAVGAVYWFWDCHILRWLGYRLEPLQEYRDGLVVHMAFNRHLKGFAASSARAARRWLQQVKDIWRRKFPWLKDDDDDDDL